MSGILQCSPEQDVSSKNACINIPIETNKESKADEQNANEAGSSTPENKNNPATQDHSPNTSTSSEIPETTQQVAQLSPTMLSGTTELHTPSLVNNPDHSESIISHDSWDYGNFQHLTGIGTSTVGNISTPATVLEQARGDLESPSEAPPPSIAFPMYPEESPAFITEAQSGGGYLWGNAWDAPPTYEDAIGEPAVRPVLLNPASLMYQQSHQQTSSPHASSTRNCCAQNRALMIILFVGTVIGFSTALYFSLMYGY